MDVLETDRPGKDSKSFLREGNDFMIRHWTESCWQPGDLFGRHGSDTDVKNKTASYINPDQWDSVSDRRSASSIGHTLQRPRPQTVCVGWGGYDQFTSWQMHGRQIKADMLGDSQDEPSWTTDLMQSVDFVNDTGEVTDTVTPSFALDELPIQTHEPVCLRDALAKKTRGTLFNNRRGRYDKK